MITNHTTLLNYLIEKYNLASYLEIGVQNPKNNFDKIKAKEKWGCDPEVINVPLVYQITSDDFFSKAKKRLKWHCIFIDGLHHAEQVKKDFDNALDHLDDGGFIVIHDTCPDEEQYTTVPRNTRKWFGDVYKFVMTLQNCHYLDFVTLDIDCGITIVWKGERRKPHYDKCWTADWQTYIEKKVEFLNIISPADLPKYLPQVKAMV